MQKMIHALYTTFRKMLAKNEPAASELTPNNTTGIPSQVAGIDVNTNQIHMTDGRIFEITEYRDPYGRTCEPEDACAVSASNGNSKLKVEFYSSRYTLH